MSAKIVRGAITDLETGLTRLVQWYPFYSADLQLTTIVKIINVDSFAYPDHSLEVQADCQALDSSGSVYQLTLVYSPTSIGERDKFLRNLKPDYIFLVEGTYGAPTDGIITMYDAEYHSVEPRFSEEEIREVFSFNAKYQV